MDTIPITRQKGMNIWLLLQHKQIVKHITRSDMNTAANIIVTNTTDINRASFMIAKSKGEINPVLLGAKLAMVAELKKRLSKGEIVEFDFYSKSKKEIRHAIGCLYGSLIAPKIQNTGRHNAQFGNVTYYDLERQDFRCFSLETLIKVY